MIVLLSVLSTPQPHSYISLTSRGGGPLVLLSPLDLYTKMLVARIAFVLLWGLAEAVPSKWGADRRKPPSHGIEMRWPDDVVTPATRR